MSQDNLVKKDVLAPELDDLAAVAWSRMKAETGLPDEDFTTRDRQVFEWTLAWCIAEGKR